MRVPIRKAGEYTNMKLDATMTEAKFAELKKQLPELKNRLPKLAAEVKRLAAMGDFSENAAYQIAKGKLRSLNQKIFELEKLLGRAIIIKPNPNKQSVQLGDTVTIENKGETKTYQILGSIETNPGQGIISQDSPLGKKLLGKKIGDIICLTVNNQDIEYKISNIS